MSETGRSLTLGERRVRLTFNPSNNDLVQKIKVKTAQLIDLCEEMWGQAVQDAPASAVELSEKARLFRLAQTHYEDAAMWAVKAATA